MKVLEIVICGLLLLLSGISVFSQIPELTADEIIRKMTKLYSSVRTYQESGTVSLVNDINAYKGKTWEDILLVRDFEKNKKVTFEFYYHRPNRLRFQWTANQPKVTRPSVIWSNGKNAYSWRTDYDENDDIFIWDKESTLERAIDQETRGSMGVADILYNALTGSKEFYSFSRMEQARVVREELVSGHECFVILGLISDDPWVLWIDKKSFALRRYRMQVATGSFDESVRTGYLPTTLGEVNHDNIQMNSPIARPTFNFRPKLRKGDIDISKYKDEQLIAPPPPKPRRDQ